MFVPRKTNVYCQAMEMKEAKSETFMLFGCFLTYNAGLNLHKFTILNGEFIII